MEIHVKNMVCNRCITAVKAEFEKVGVVPLNIELGKVTISNKLTKDQSEALNNNLTAIGFEIIDDRRNRLIEQIKNIIVKEVHYTEQHENLNLSDILVRDLHHDYSYLSSLFSETEGITIEKYQIRQKTERVKELLTYDDYSISQIADILGYSSVAHLSNQFKQITGMTPSAFKKNSPHRKPLDKV